MKFYMVWDKENQRYVTTRRFVGSSTSSPRTYSEHRHAAAAATGWINRNGRQSSEETKRIRQERFEIHEYETDEYTVVG